MAYSSWNRVLLNKPITSHLVKKFPRVYGIQRLITRFTRTVLFADETNILVTAENGQSFE
jgi:hypothetical protein